MRTSSVGHNFAILPWESGIWNEPEQPEIKRLRGFTIAFAVAYIEIHVLEQPNAGRCRGIPKLSGRQSTTSFLDRRSG